MDGFIIGVDIVIIYIIDGEIYVFEYDGMLWVKFVYCLFGGGICLCSFNCEEYLDEEYLLEDMCSCQISMIGWVFWWFIVCYWCGLFLVW